MPWPVGPTDPSVAAHLTEALRRALDGSGPAIAPFAIGALSGAPSATSVLPRTVAPDVCLVVRTSGSSGGARGVLLGRDAIMASVEATHTRLGGPGRWVVALPLAHVAGLQVLIRSIVAGTEPVVVEAQRFTPEALAAAADAADGAQRLYTSLVPTQLHRVVAAGSGGSLPPELAGLRRFDAVLVGGAATSSTLLTAARALGLAVVTTYGMTETCGGCVYDGVPLDGVRVALDDGVVRIAGPVLAHGYLPGPGPDPFTTDQGGVRWLTTRDLGELADGRLRVVGRRDDTVITGGQKVDPAAVEDVLAGVRGVGQVCVVGVADDEWGQSLTAVVVADATGPPALAHLRDAASRTLGSASAPRRLVLVAALPERGPGKVDRAAVAAMAAVAARSTD
ncbi:MAG: AMP-binding protein [Cellulomonadaceae bacterium]|nr:AMP-binding protein [Cellulomonadaceae bacterium]